MHRPITHELVAALRDRTGAPLSDCKQALVEHSGSMYRAYHQLLANRAEGQPSVYAPPPASQIDCPMRRRSTWFTVEVRAGQSIPTIGLDTRAGN